MERFSLLKSYQDCYTSTRKGSSSLPLAEVHQCKIEMGAYINAFVNQISLHPIRKYDRRLPAVLLVKSYFHLAVLYQPIPHLLSILQS